MILITCVVSSIVTERASRRMALHEMEAAEPETSDGERVLISVSNPNTLFELVSLAVLIRDSKNTDNVIAVNVVSDSDNRNVARSARQGKRFLEMAAQAASGSGMTLKTVSRYSADVATGVIHTAKEQEATTIILGIHRKLTAADSHSGPYSEAFLSRLHREVVMIKMLMPFNTLRRIVVAVPPKAQFEPGFSKWMNQVLKVGRTLGCQIHFHCSHETAMFVRLIVDRQGYSDKVRIEQMDSWDEFMMLSASVNYDHLLIAAASRPGGVSYLPDFEKLPDMLAQYFGNCSTMIVYPDQTGEPVQLPAFSQPINR